MTAAIVDTSAMIAMLQLENGYVALRDTMATSAFVVPAPVLVEFWRVARRGNKMPVEIIGEFLDVVMVNGSVIPFVVEHAHAAAAAAETYGTGNGRGGTLNMLDLMVYGVAKVTGLPILCTGKDFASTDALIHPASRVG